MQCKQNEETQVVYRRSITHFLNAKNRFGSNVDVRPSHRHCEKPSKIESQAILSTWMTFGAALVNNQSLSILFTLHRDFAIYSPCQTRSTTHYADLHKLSRNRLCAAQRAIF